MERSDLPEGQHPNASDLDIGDEVSFHLTSLPSQSRRVIGKVEAIREDGLVTAAFPQEGWTPMLITAPAADFVRIRTSPDLEAVEARVRAQVAEEIARDLARAADDVMARADDPGLAAGHATGLRMAVHVAREHAGKGFPSSPAALPDVVGTPDRVWWYHEPCFWSSGPFLASEPRPRRCAGCFSDAGDWLQLVPVRPPISAAEGGGVADLSKDPHSP